MSTEQIPHITCEHLLGLHGKPRDKREHVVIDLREAADFENGHIEGSHHVPHKELMNIESLVPEKEKKVVVILGPTQEREIAKIHQELKDMDYENVEFLAGGIDSWCEIADVEVSDVLGGEQTPEERGMIDSEHSNTIDRDNGSNEPLY